MSKKDKKVKKDKATKKAEKLEKKLAKKEQKAADKKNPEVKAAKKVLAIKCISAILCAVIFYLTVSSASTKLADAIKTAAETEAMNSGASMDAGLSMDSGLDSTPSLEEAGDAGTSEDATQEGEAAEGETSGKPADGVETLNYFNTAINKVKTGAKTVEQKSVTNYLAGETTIPSGIQGIYNMLGEDDWLDGMLRDNSQGAATYTGADIKAKFPVEGESYASKLTGADVTSATCTEANGVYTITIVTKGDAKSENHQHGQGHAPKALNVILPGVVNDNIPGIAKSMVGTASMAYPASTIKITVDAETGNVLTADYDLKWTINFDKMGIVLPFGTKAVYEIKW